jgi:hypothetical protein
MATKIRAEMKILSTVTIEAQKSLVDNIFISQKSLVENIFISARIFVAIWHMATW